MKKVDFRTEETSECGFATTITGNVMSEDGKKQPFNLILNNREHTMGVVMVNPLGKEEANQESYNDSKEWVLAKWKLRQIEVNVKKITL